MRRRSIRYGTRDAAANRTSSSQSSSTTSRKSPMRRTWGIGAVLVVMLALVGSTGVELGRERARPRLPPALHGHAHRPQGKYRGAVVLVPRSSRSRTRQRPPGRTPRRSTGATARRPAGSNSGGPTYTVNGTHTYAAAGTIPGHADDQAVGRSGVHLAQDGHPDRQGRAAFGPVQRARRPLDDGPTPRPTPAWHPSRRPAGRPRPTGNFVVRAPRPPALSSQPSCSRIASTAYRAIIFLDNGATSPARWQAGGFGTEIVWRGPGPHRRTQKASGRGLLLQRRRRRRHRLRPSSSTGTGSS